MAEADSPIVVADIPASRLARIRKALNKSEYAVLLELLQLWSEHGRSVHPSNYSLGLRAAFKGEKEAIVRRTKRALDGLAERHGYIRRVPRRAWYGKGKQLANAILFQGSLLYDLGMTSGQGVTLFCPPQNGLSTRGDKNLSGVKLYKRWETPAKPPPRREGGGVGGSSMQRTYTPIPDQLPDWL